MLSMAVIAVPRFRDTCNWARDTLGYYVAICNTKSMLSIAYNCLLFCSK